MLQLVIIQSLILIFSLNAYAKKEVIQLGTFLIPKFVESNKEGEFIELTKLILENSQFEIQISVYPPKRTIELFNKGELDGYFPSLDTLHSKNDQRLKSDFFYIKKDYLFAKNKKLIQDFKSHTICITQGYPYVQDFIEKNLLEINSSTSDESCLLMIDKNRVDLFLGEALSGLYAIQKTHLKNIYISKKPVSEQEVYFSFQNNKKGLSLQALFNHKIKLLKSNGELASLFSEVILLAKKELNIEINPIE